jgi:hypothetical protein
VSNRKKLSWISAIGLIGLCAASIAMASDASDAPDAYASRDAEIMSALDRYMEGLNDLDLEKHVRTYHFPHYRHASGKIVVWESAREAIPVLDLPREERRSALRAVLEPDWHRSEWTRREVVQGDDQKVHVVTQFVRLREDGSVIKTFDSLYVMTKESGRWGIKGRSSFAP